MLKFVVVIAFLSSLSLTMIGCNTVHGAGEDTKEAGQSIKNAADNNK